MKWEGEKIISISSAADLCNVSRATIWRWIKIGELKAGKTAGGHYRILRQDLLDFIAQKNMLPTFRDPVNLKRVLVVDDDPVLFRLFQRILTASEYELEYAVDGFDAGIKVMAFKPDLVVLDLFLPNMNGFEVCRQLRANQNTRHLKILAVSGYDTQPNRKQILESGADLFLPKPLDTDVVLKEMGRLLQ